MVLIETFVRNDVVVSESEGASNLVVYLLLLFWIARLVLKTLQLVIEVDDVESLLVPQGSVLMVRRLPCFWRGFRWHDLARRLEFISQGLNQHISAEWGGTHSQSA